MKTGLAPIADQKSEMLILGSLPGDESIMRGQYYAQKRNHFWPIISAVLSETLHEPYEARVQMLLLHRVALWDVLHSAQREGSLDTNIRNERPNDLPAFLAAHKRIRFVLLNGNAALRYFKKYFASLEIPCECVRSSSPVPARECNSLEEKIAVWSRAWKSF